MPAIVICRKKAYSDVKKDMSTLEGYLNNTLSLNYSVRGHTWKTIGPNSTELKREYVYSYTRGLCVVLKYMPEVRLEHFEMLQALVVY